MSLEHFRAILAHLTGSPGPMGRRGSQVDVVHRPRIATPPWGLENRPSVAPPSHSAALRCLPDVPHRAAQRAYPNGSGAPSNGSKLPGSALVARSLAAFLLLWLAGCDGIDLKVSFPDFSRLSDLAALETKKPVWRSPLLQKHHLVGRIWRPADGRFVDQQTMLEDLVRSAFILLGEKHDNPDHHLLQARLISSLIDLGRRPAVVWEMIPETRQPILDRFHNQYSRNAAALGAALGWDVSGWPVWRLYQPVAEAAMAGNLAMYAAGLPKPIVRAIARGRPSFEFAKRRRVLGLDRPLREVLRARSIEQLFQGHCELMPREKLTPLFNVQRARDAVFAEHMLSGGAEDGAILIAGDGHVRKDLGVPPFLLRHQPGVRVTTVAFVEVQDEVLDPIEYGEFFSAPVLPFDYVWFTPRADDKDHCAKLRKRWGKPENTKPKTEPKTKPKTEPKTVTAPKTPAPKLSEPKPEKKKPVVAEPADAAPKKANPDEVKSKGEAEPEAKMPPPTPKSEATKSAGSSSGQKIPKKIENPEKPKTPKTPLPPVPRTKPRRP